LIVTSQASVRFDNHDSRIRPWAVRLLAGLLAIAMAACAVPISYYDATTYTQLTSLKAETTALIETFDEKPFARNEDKIEATMLNLRKAHEYEKGKGSPNSDTARQFEKIAKLYSETIGEYKQHGPKALGPKYFREAALVLGQAFDIAIATENSKNKDKR
jgi:hypothetical protein